MTGPTPPTGRASAQQWAHAHQYKQQQKERTCHPVEPGRRHRNSFSRQNLAEHRVKRTPQYDERNAGKQPVIGQECPFPARD